MKFAEFMEDHIIFVLTCILYLSAQSCVLYFLGNYISMILLLDTLWICIFMSYYLYTFYKKKKRFSAIDHICEELDHAYLLHEVMPWNGNNEENYYRHLLYISNKSMMEEVSSIRRERLAYQEYIEQWVHEIKTPIAAMKLWSENQQVERKRDLMLQLERTEHYVEQALYYARSENVKNDFHIHEVDLSSCVHESLLSSKYLCMNSAVRMEIPQTSYYVYTDEKWVVFILNQLIENAVKYRRQKDAMIRITIEEKEETMHMQVWDNGVGIHACDLPRVFEKGFTGENGRMSNSHSTGIGLYLCHQLCTSLGVDLHMNSVWKEYTCVELVFPAKSYRTVSGV